MSEHQTKDEDILKSAIEKYKDIVEDERRLSQIAENFYQTLITHLKKDSIDENSLINYLKSLHSHIDSNLNINLNDFIDFFETNKSNLKGILDQDEPLITLYLQVDADTLKEAFKQTIKEYEEENNKLNTVAESVHNEDTEQVEIPSKIISPAFDQWLAFGLGLVLHNGKKYEPYIKISSDKILFKNVDDSEVETFILLTKEQIINNEDYLLLFDNPKYQSSDNKDLYNNPEFFRRLKYDLARLLPGNIFEQLLPEINQEVKKVQTQIEDLIKKGYKNIFTNKGEFIILRYSVLGNNTVLDIEFNDSNIQLNEPSVTFNTEYLAKKLYKNNIRIDILKTEEKNRESFEHILKNFEEAKNVEPYELTRKADNDGKPLDQNYVKNQQKIRALFVDTITNSSLYYDDKGNHFSEILKKAHRFANEDNIYQSVGKGQNEVNAGEFTYGERMKNKRESESREIADIAKNYGDQYQNRFSSHKEMRVDLEGISNEFLPFDFYSDYRDYTFYYPPSEAIPQYMEQINKIGIEINQQLKQENLDMQKILSLIAKQYQYGAIARPFNQINNSLFMNLVNAQLKLIGFHGISHGNLDLAAQRLQPKNFIRMFIDHVQLSQPQQTNLSK